LQTFGAGNMPSKRRDIIEELKRAIERGCIVVNCSQCMRGQVDAHYLTGKVLYDIGVIPGSDMTAEAALTKLSYVLSKDSWSHSKKMRVMGRSIRGELTVTQPDPLHDLEIGMFFTIEINTDFVYRAENFSMSFVPIVMPQMARFLHMSTSREVKFLRGVIFPPLLCHAANTGDVELLEGLHENGANLSAVDYSGRSALHVAASAGHADAV
uniref:asparaginase n=1 Tax=Gongylonema pulchrum TaxID=637853 RepID=A0A183EQQ4_9BILA